MKPMELKAEMMRMMKWLFLLTLQIVLCPQRSIKYHRIVLTAAKNVKFLVIVSVSPSRKRIQAEKIFLQRVEGSHQSERRLTRQMCGFRVRVRVRMASSALFPSSEVVRLIRISRVWGLAPRYFFTSQSYDEAELCLHGIPFLHIDP